MKAVLQACLAASGTTSMGRSTIRTTKTTSGRLMRLIARTHGTGTTITRRTALLSGTSRTVN